MNNKIIGWTESFPITLMESIVADSSDQKGNYSFSAYVTKWDDEKEGWSIKSRNGVRYNRGATKEVFELAIEKNNGIPVMYNHITEGSEANTLGRIFEIEDTKEGLIVKGILDGNEPLVKNKISKGILSNVSLQVSADEVKSKKIKEGETETYYAFPDEAYEVSFVPVNGIVGGNLLATALMESLKLSKAEELTDNLIGKDGSLAPGDMMNYEEDKYIPLTCPFCKRDFEHEIQHDGVRNIDVQCPNCTNRFQLLNYSDDMVKTKGKKDYYMKDKQGHDINNEIVDLMRRIVGAMENLNAMQENKKIKEKMDVKTMSQADEGTKVKIPDITTIHGFIADLIQKGKKREKILKELIEEYPLVDEKKLKMLLDMHYRYLKESLDPKDMQILKKLIIKQEVYDIIDPEDTKKREELENFAGNDQLARVYGDVEAIMKQMGETMLEDLTLSNTGSATATKLYGVDEEEENIISTN